MCLSYAGEGAMHSARSHYHIYAWAGCWCACRLQSRTVVFHAVVGALYSAQYLLLTLCACVCTLFVLFCCSSLQFRKLLTDCLQAQHSSLTAAERHYACALCFNWLYCCCCIYTTIPLGLLCYLLLAASMVPLIVALTVNTIRRDINWFPYQYPCTEWCCQG